MHKTDQAINNSARARARDTMPPLCTMSNETLDTLMQRMIDEYKARGLSAHVCEMMASELEDLHLERVGAKGLAQRASALDLSIIDGGVA